jgi:AraC-like DNA-binding protein
MTIRSRRSQHAQAGVRFGQFGSVVYPPGAHLSARELWDYEFVWISRGNVVWERDGTEEHVGPGTVILSRPGTVESYTWDERRRTQHGFVHFDIRKPIGSLPKPESWPWLRRVDTDDALRPLLKHIVWLLDARPSGWHLAAESALAHALLIFVNDLTRTVIEPEPSIHPVLERALAYLRRVWVDAYRNVSLEELAERSGSSASHLNRLFRDELEMSAGKAMRQLRLQRAGTLLSRSSLPVQSISELVGFSTPFHFSDSFRQSYGISPREYRRRVTSGEGVPTLILGRLRAFYAQET